jgi:hypothetical protein
MFDKSRRLSSPKDLNFASDYTVRTPAPKINNVNKNKNNRRKSNKTYSFPIYADDANLFR